MLDGGFLAPVSSMFVFHVYLNPKVIIDSHSTKVVASKLCVDIF